MVEAVRYYVASRTTAEYLQHALRWLSDSHWVLVQYVGNNVVLLRLGLLHSSINNS